MFISIASNKAEEERLLLGELSQMSMALSRRLHERAMANEGPYKDAGRYVSGPTDAVIRIYA